MVKKVLLKISLLLFFFGLGVSPARAGCESCGNYFVVTDEGEVKATVDLRASVPNGEEDYHLELESRPRREVLPGNEIVYTIFYGCSGSMPTEKITLSVEWVQPVGRVAEYVPGSASKAYGDALPQVNKEKGSISWEISDFPGDTTSQKISFKLKVKDNFDSSGTFPIELRARMVIPGMVKETVKRVTVTYPEERIEEMFPQVPATVYRYAQEFFSHPVFQTVFFRFLLIFAFLLPFFTLVTALLYLDFPLAFLPFLIPFWLRRFLIFLGVVDHEPVWGRVFWSYSGAAVPLVRVRVFDFSGRELGSTFTNRSGSFGFDLPEDHYLIEVKKPGFSLNSVQKDGIFLTEERFLFKFEQGKDKEAVLNLKRVKFLPIFWERFLEGFALSFSDFLVFLGVGLSITYALLVGSLLSILLACFFFVYLLSWTFLVFR